MRAPRGGCLCLRETLRGVYEMQSANERPATRVPLRSAHQAGDELRGHGVVLPRLQSRRLLCGRGAPSRVQRGGLPLRELRVGAFLCRPRDHTSRQQAVAHLDRGWIIGGSGLGHWDLTKRTWEICHNLEAGARVRLLARMLKGWIRPHTMGSQTQGVGE